MAYEFDYISFSFRKFLNSPGGILVQTHADKYVHKILIYCAILCAHKGGIGIISYTYGGCADKIILS